MLDHRFDDGRAFTVGIEEELMLVDRETLDLAPRIEDVLAAVPPELEGKVKPELMESVLEIATGIHPSVASAREELTELRRLVTEVAESLGCLIAAAGTHPFGRWEEQPIVDRERYREVVADLGIIARRELIFGTHVHIGVRGADRAVYVADGIRRYLPLLLALSVNSPFWRGSDTGLMSARVPVFRGFPRSGIPPHYGSWEIYSRRVELMMASGAIPEYTFLWFDVRPHPSLGTVETRIFDQQTRIEHTIALAALTQSLARRLAILFDEGEPMIEAPTELVDDNKVRAAVRGLEGELIDFAQSRVRPARDMVTHLISSVEGDAAILGCSAELASLEELIEGGTGARRQLEAVKGGLDARSLVAELVKQTRVS